MKNRDVKVTDLRALSSTQIAQELKSGIIKIAVVGLGHVGLPLALLLAKKGAFLVGVDKQQKVLEKLARGVLPIFEPGLPDLLGEVGSRKLHLTSDLTGAVSEGDIVVVCVGTSVDRHGKPLLADLMRVTESIGKSLGAGKAVMVRSTIPPGTTEGAIRSRLEKPRRLQAGNDFALAYCPERLVEGNALREIENVPHIVGAADELSFRVAEGFFGFMGGEVLRAATIATAEMAKVFDNVYREMNISLANELALICEPLGVDVLEAIKVANTGPRTRLLMPGCGVGGSCLTKDPLMLGYVAKVRGIRPTLIAASRQRNRYMPRHMIHLVRSAFRQMHKRVAGARFAMMGLAYKGDTDDVRESVAIYISRMLFRLKAKVVGYDPYVSEENMFKVFGKLTLARDPFEAARESDCIIITADHKKLKNIAPAELARLVNKPAALIDGRNIFDPAEVIKAGFIFRGVGRFPRSLADKK